MYAVIRTGGKQYKVEPGQNVMLEKLEGKPGDKVYFDDVLLVSEGKDISAGNPVLENSRVSGKITKHGKGPKIVVFKYKPRKGYRRKKGHRQNFTEVNITDIKKQE